jgi:hypothetical protein
MESPAQVQEVHECVPRSAVKVALTKPFTVPPEKISTGECVLVKHDLSKAGEPDSYWKAKVLEVRALDFEHVFSSSGMAKPAGRPANG